MDFVRASGLSLKEVREYKLLFDSMDTHSESRLTP
jgi:hypothetical protein